jgi:hypothetical protein
VPYLPYDESVSFPNLDGYSSLSLYYSGIDGDGDHDSLDKHLDLVAVSEFGIDVFRIPDVVSAGGILCFDHIPPSDIPSVVSDNAMGQNCCLALLCLKSFTICLAALIVSFLQSKQMLA